MREEIPLSNVAGPAAGAWVRIVDGLGGGAKADFGATAGEGPWAGVIGPLLFAAAVLPVSLRSEGLPVLVLPGLAVWA